MGEKHRNNRETTPSRKDRDEDDSKRKQANPESSVTEKADVKRDSVVKGDKKKKDKKDKKDKKKKDKKHHKKKSEDRKDKNGSSSSKPVVKET